MSVSDSQIKNENGHLEITNVPSDDPKPNLLSNNNVLTGNVCNNLIVSAQLVTVDNLSQNIEIVQNKMNDKVVEQKIDSVSMAGNEIIINTLKDIIFNLILNNKSLRSKLNELLETPQKAIEDISKIFNEISDKLTAQDIDNLRKFICIENSRNSLGGILVTSFNEIMADGKIDLNDTNHFLTLIYNIINLFNDYTQKLEQDISLNTDTIFYFLYFTIKCTLVLTLDGEEETLALGLLDTTFKLVRISIIPLSQKKCTCNLFSCFKKN